MSWLTQQINAKTRGVLRIPINDPGTPHLIDEPVNLRCAVEVEAGTEINVNQTIISHNGASWLGDGGMHTLNKSGANHLFYMAGTEQNFGSFITNEGSSTDGYTFFIDTTQNREHIRIEKVRTYQGLGLISDNNLSGQIINMHLDDVMARMHRGRGSYLSRAFAYISLKNCTVDYVGTNTNVPAWVFIGTEGLELDYVDMTGTAINGNTPQQYGFYFDNVRALTIKHAMADNAGGYGFYFKNCNWVDASILKASMCGDIGVVACNSTCNLRIANLYVSGRDGKPGNKNSPLLWTDDSVYNVHSLQTIASSGTVNGGHASTKFTHGRLVN